MSKAHYRRQWKSRHVRGARKALAKAKFWVNVARSNARLNSGRRYHGK